LLTATINLECSMPLRRRVPLAVLLAAAMASCGGENADPSAAALQQALQQKYPGAEFAVSFLKDRRLLRLTVDTAVYGNYRLDDSKRRALGEQIARIAVDSYRSGSGVDSITVQFVQERSGGLFSKSWSMMEVRLAVAGLR
jgi:hypothetical protein